MTRIKRRYRLGEIRSPIINDPLLKDKRFGISASREWLFEDNSHYLYKFIDENFHPSDHDDIFQFFYDDPKMAMILIKDYFKSNADKIREVINQFSRGKSKIGVIVGGRGSGKTALAFWLAEKLQKERAVWVVGSDNPNIPKEFFVAQRVEDTPRGSLVIVDESGIQFSAREYQHKGHVNLTKMLTVLRHDNKSILFITQHTALSDVNLIRLSDCIFYKKQSSFQAVTERKLSSNRNMAQLLISLMPKKINETLFVMGSRPMKFKCGLPSFWSDKVSKSWTNMGVKLKQEQSQIVKKERVKAKSKSTGKYICD